MMQKLRLIPFLLMFSFSVSAQTELKHIDHVSFEKLQKDHPNLIILDVRTPWEYASGHVPKAINIPHSDIDAIRNTVKPDQPVIMYCRSGRRVGIVANQLLASGYKAVYHLQGDMPGWINAGKPVAKKP